MTDENSIRDKAPSSPIEGHGVTPSYLAASGPPRKTDYRASKSE
jgi:hypothetical protein